MSVFRKVKQQYADTYVDNYEIPHRKLTDRELYMLFTTIEERAEECYLRRDHAQSRQVEELKQRLVELKDQAANNPRYAELIDLNTAVCDRFEDATEDARPALRAEQSAIYAQIAAITGPIRAAEKELEKARHEYDLLRIEVKEAQIIMALQAGQREGLRFGLKIASLLLEGAPVSGIDHMKASLLVAGAMVNDTQADALVGAQVQAEMSAT